LTVFIKSNKTNGMFVLVGFMPS